MIMLVNSVKLASYDPNLFFLIQEILTNWSCITAEWRLEVDADAKYSLKSNHMSR